MLFTQNNDTTLLIVFYTFIILTFFRILCIEQKSKLPSIPVFQSLTKKNSNPLKVYGTDIKLWNLPDAAKVNKGASNNLNTGSGIQESSFSRNLTVWKFALLLTHPRSLQSVRLAMDLEKVKTIKGKFYSIIHLLSSITAQLYENYLQMQTIRVQQSSMQLYLEYRSSWEKKFFHSFFPHLSGHLSFSPLPPN